MAPSNDNHDQDHCDDDNDDDDNNHCDDDDDDGDLGNIAGDYIGLSVQYSMARTKIATNMIHDIEHVICNQT